MRRLRVSTPNLCLHWLIFTFYAINSVTMPEKVKTNDTKPVIDLNPTPAEERSRDDVVWHDGPHQKSDGNLKKNSIPSSWTELLTRHWAGAARITVHWHTRGSSYKPLFSEGITEIVGADLDGQVGSHLRKTWARVLKYTHQHGPILNFMLVIEGPVVDGERLELGRQTTRCSTIEVDTKSEEFDTPYMSQMLLANTSAMLLEARKFMEDSRNERHSLVTALQSVLSSTTETVQRATSLVTAGIGLIEQGAKYSGDLLKQTVDRESRRLEAEFNAAKIQAVAEALGKATDVLSGEASAAFFHWMASKGGENHDPPPLDLIDAAAELRRSVTVAQSDLMGESWDLIEHNLVLAAHAKSPETAIPFFGVIFAELADHMDALKPTMTPRQSMILAFIRGRVAVSTG